MHGPINIKYENSFATKEISERCVISSESSGSITATLAVYFGAVFFVSLSYLLLKR